MSGGSFEYLYYKLKDEPLSEYNLSLLEDMIMFLNDEMNETEMASELRELHTHLTETLRQSKEKVEKLSDLMYAIEWYVSGDSYYIDEAWEEYKAGK